MVVILLCGGPLLAFTRPLRQLKGRTTLAASLVATRHQRAVERILLVRNMSAAEDADDTPAGE